MNLKTGLTLSVYPKREQNIGDQQGRWATIVMDICGVGGWRWLFLLVKQTQSCGSEEDENRTTNNPDKGVHGESILFLWVASVEMEYQVNNRLKQVFPLLGKP